MGVVLDDKLVYNIIQITTPCFHCTPFAECRSILPALWPFVGLPESISISNKLLARIDWPFIGQTVVISNKLFARYRYRMKGPNRLAFHWIARVDVEHTVWRTRLPAKRADRGMFAHVQQPYIYMYIYTYYAVYVCMYNVHCVYIYIYIYICIYVYLYLYLSLYIYIYRYIHMCMYLSLSLYIYISLYI